MRVQTDLTQQDYQELKKESKELLGLSGHLYPPFGGIEDYVEYQVFDMNDNFKERGKSVNYTQDDDKIILNIGQDLRDLGYNKGNYKVKYYFVRPKAGSGDEVVLTKTVDGEVGLIHSGNPAITGEPMGDFYVDDDGNAFIGVAPPTDGTESIPLDIKEWKYKIDQISGDRTEVRIVPQIINNNKYRDEFRLLSSDVEQYRSIKSAPITQEQQNEAIQQALALGIDPQDALAELEDNQGGEISFTGPDSTRIEFNQRIGSDTGFQQIMKDGKIVIKNAYVVDYRVEPDLNVNTNYVQEGPIPPAYIEAYDLKDAGFPMSVRYVVKDEATQLTLYGHDFDGYQPIPNLTTPGVRYHFDFGCGHTEIHDAPFANHTYDSEGVYSPTVTIMTPNYDLVVSDLYKNTDAPLDGPGLRGSELRGFSPTPMGESVEEPGTPLSSAFDGMIVRWDGNTNTGIPQKTYPSPTEQFPAATTTRWFIQNGVRRWIASSHNLQLLRDTMNIPVQTATSVDDDGNVTTTTIPDRSIYNNLLKKIPVGPQIDGTSFLASSEYPVNQPLILEEFQRPLLGNYDPNFGEGDDEGGDDEGGDDEGGDGGTSETQQQNFNLVLGGGFINPGVGLETLPYEDSNGEEFDLTFTINGTETDGNSFSQSFPSGTEVTVGVNYFGPGFGGAGFQQWSDGSFANPRTITMDSQKVVTAEIGLLA